MSAACSSRAPSGETGQSPTNSSSADDDPDRQDPADRGADRADDPEGSTTSGQVGAVGEQAVTLTTTPLVLAPGEMTHADVGAGGPADVLVPPPLEDGPIVFHRLDDEFGHSPEVVVVGPDAGLVDTLEMGDASFVAASWWLGFPGFALLNNGGEGEWLRLADGRRSPTGGRALYLTHSGLVIQETPTDDPAVHGPEGPYALPADEFVVEAAGGTVFVVEADDVAVKSVGAYRADAATLTLVHRFEVPDVIDVIDASLARSGEALAVILSRGGETWVEVLDLVEPGSRRLVADDLDVDAQAVSAVLIDRDIIGISSPGGLRVADLAAGTLTEPVPLDRYLGATELGFVVSVTADALAGVSKGGLALLTASSGLHVYEVPMSSAEQPRYSAVSSTWMSASASSPPFWCIDPATLEAHLFDLDELVPGAGSAFLSTFDGHRAYVTTRDGLFIADVNGVWTFRPGLVQQRPVVAVGEVSRRRGRSEAREQRDGRTAEDRCARS